VTPSTGAAGTPPLPPTIDDFFTGAYGDADTFRGSNGSKWWRLRLAASSVGTHIQLDDDTSLHGSQIEEVTKPCGGHLCVWYRQLCNGNYSDAFSYTRVDDANGEATKAEAAITITYNDEAKAADRCLG
jgi:hypothetical protein